jgi:hypothetical protein
MPPLRRTLYACTLIATMMGTRLNAVTLSELTNDPQLNAKRFAAYFEHFEYEFHAEVPASGGVPRAERGDCERLCDSR